jgi:hypothetical protein
VAADQQRGDLGSAGVLVEVALAHARTGDDGDAGLFQEDDVVLGKDAALLQRPLAQVERVGERHALGLLAAEFTEDHLE